MDSFKEKLKKVVISGQEVLPIVEGGKGVGATNGYSSGAFAAAGAIGTVSAVNAQRLDNDGNPIYPEYSGATRRDRHRELVQFGIESGIQHVKIADEIAGGNGRIHINVLWEMGGAAEVLKGILEGTNGMVHGVTCGAGMPYKLSEIAENYNIYYHPIVSSMRAFRALWKRAYNKVPKLLGSVVYEDPWLAGGHNGLSNSEDPEKPEDPYPRVAELRTYMNEVGLNETPILMAGGVWYLRDWENWLDNPDIGPIAFQYGTRPLLTKESPIPECWKKKLLELREDDVFLNRFSPTGFYSSAVNNNFIKELCGRSERQVKYATEEEGYQAVPIPFGPRKRNIYIAPEDKARVDEWIKQGFDEPMKTPDGTIIFVSKEKAGQIHDDQVACMGCLSHCKFSNWKDHDDFTTDKKPDPRSFCIQKTLQDIVFGKPVDNQLQFSGHNAFKFAEDPLFNQGNIPTIQELVDSIVEGN